MNRKIITPALLLLSLVALTACPNNDRNNNPAANQLRAPPPVSPVPPVGGGNPPSTNPIQLDPSIKSFQCEFEGQRYKSHKYFSSNVYIPKTTSLITLGGPGEQTVYLRTKFLGLDPGKFGTMYMRYVPAAKDKSRADTIILANEGLDKNMRMTQSGFAGQEVKLEAQDDGMFISISCKGATQFKESPAHTGKTNLVCTGKSSTATSAEEEINTIIPLNSIIAGESFAISQGSGALTAKLDSTASTITYVADIDPGYAPIVVSTASLKSATRFYLVGNSRDQYSSGKISVTCGIQ